MACVLDEYDIANLNAHLNLKELIVTLMKSWNLMMLLCKVYTLHTTLFYITSMKSFRYGKYQSDMQPGQASGISFWKVS